MSFSKSRDPVSETSEATGFAAASVELGRGPGARVAFVKTESANGLILFLRQWVFRAQKWENI